MVEASEWQVPVKCLFIVLVCAVLVANIAQTIRRMHDINLPGWCWFIYLLPFVSYLFSCGVTLIDGTPGPNRFGPDPKGRPSYQP
jgi:uncharacterized membrane protein YhaH (DUF805 family)